MFALPAVEMTDTPNMCVELAVCQAVIVIDVNQMNLLSRLLSLPPRLLIHQMMKSSESSSSTVASPRGGQGGPQGP